MSSTAVFSFFLIRLIIVFGRISSSTMDRAHDFFSLMHRKFHF